MTDIRAYANSDHVLVIHRPEEKLTEASRGFAIERQYVDDGGAPVGDPETLENWTGWEGEQVPRGTFRPSTEWPIQRLIWADFLVRPDATVRYRAIPMNGAKDALEAGTPSGWSDPVRVAPSAGDGVETYFNRGMVAAQWVARRLKEDVDAKLPTRVKHPGDRLREELAGVLRPALLAVLDDAHRRGVEVYAALFELDDPELLPALAALGKRAHVVLANGAAKDGHPHDENEEAADALRDVVDLHRRCVEQRKYLAHNKFLVVCDEDGTPESAWTGSTNWTATGLCTQVNNAVLVRSPAVARAFRDHWQVLCDAGNRPPPEIATKAATGKTKLRTASTRTWFTAVEEPADPADRGADLADAYDLIAAAKDGILFLMFNPGPSGTLLNDIVARASPLWPTYDERLYIRGVLNQDPSSKNHSVGLFGAHPDPHGKNFSVVLPWNVEEQFAFWDEEMRKMSGTWAMVHSKVIVLDPFGARPVVMTGSHNLGPKASLRNDDNLIVFENAPALARQYAVNIMGVYMQYRWRYNNRGPAKPKPGAPPPPPPPHPPHQWAGLRDSAAWWHGLLDGAKGRELAFWLPEPDG